MKSLGQKYLVYAFIIPALIWIIQISLSFTLSMFFPEVPRWFFHVIKLVCFVLTVGLLFVVFSHKEEGSQTMRYVCLSFGAFISLIILVSNFANILLDVGVRV